MLYWFLFLNSYMLVNYISVNIKTVMIAPMQLVFSVHTFFKRENNRQNV